MKSILRLPTSQFRSIQAPAGDSKVGLFYVKANSLSPELWDWRDVNPREVNRASKIYKGIVNTLTQEPARFHERNRGITIVAEELTYDDKRKDAVLCLSNNKLHGVVDGAHTLDAVLQTQKQPPENGWPAYVFLKVITGVDGDQIAEIAGGLNTSQQVDLKSLENLRDHFKFLQKVLRDEPYADKIAYRMNEEKPIDVRDVLYYLAVFDCSVYDEKRHPVALFGRKEGIIRRFADQAEGEKDAGDSFRILISKAPEILHLRDMIEKKAISEGDVGRYRAGKSTRIRSEVHRDSPLMFLNETIDGKIPLGWLMPMLAAFRANIEWDRPKNSFSWTVPVDELLDRCITRLVLGIKEVHEQENARPEYVGRNSIAWRMSYQVVSQAILEWQLARARARK